MLILYINAIISIKKSMKHCGYKRIIFVKMSASVNITWSTEKIPLPLFVPDNPKGRNIYQIQKMHGQALTNIHAPHKTSGIRTQEKQVIISNVLKNSIYTFETSATHQSQNENGITLTSTHSPGYDIFSTNTKRSHHTSFKKYINNQQWIKCKIPSTDTFNDEMQAEKL